MQEDYSLLVASVYELVEKIQAQQFIISVTQTDSEISFTYRNGFKQRFSLLRQNNDKIDLDSLKSDISKGITDKLNNDFALGLENIQKSMLLDSENLKGKCDSVLHSLSEELKLTAKDSYATLFTRIDNKLLELVSALPLPKDGKDADNDLIIQNITSKFEEYKNSLSDMYNAELRKYLAEIELPKDGVDGQDADEEKIFNKLLNELEQILDTNFTNLSQQLINLVAAQKDELVSIVTQSMVELIESLPTPKDGQDGRNGIDGQDADSQVIEANLLKKLNAFISSENEKNKNELIEIINKSINKSVKSLTLALKQIKAVKAERGREGEKGEKGDKGKDGNGIINAKINDDDHLIIETDEKTIDAGKLRIKKYLGGGNQQGNIFLYSNELSMPVDVGLIPKGTKFKDTDLKVLFTKLLYGYNFPKFVDFFIAGLLNNVEIGYSIIAGNYQTSFTIQDPELLRPDSITILKEGQVLLENLPNVSPVNVTLAGETKNTIDVITFEIFAYDTTGVSFNKYFTVNCKYRIYYGEYTEDITDTGFPNPLIVLRASELVIDIYGEYFFQNIPLGSNYKWFCYPSILGENYIFYDTVSDIALILNDVLKINIVNEYGLVIEYNCYRTLNEIHEDIIMKVKSG
jgi:hypothetical protein